jgi:hypothetical protein
MGEAVRTMASTAEVWAIVIVSVLVTAFLVSATAVAYAWQNRYHRRLRAAGMWDMAIAAGDSPSPEHDAPGIISTEAGRMGPAGPGFADMEPARTTLVGSGLVGGGIAYVPAPRPARHVAAAAPEPADQGDVPTRVDLPAQSQPVPAQPTGRHAAQPGMQAQPGMPAQRGAPASEQAQPTFTRPGSADADDHDQE